MDRLEHLLTSYSEDRKRANALYGLYKDYTDRMKSWDSQLRSEIDSLAKPLTKREKDYLIKIIERDNKEPF